MQKATVLVDQLSLHRYPAAPGIAVIRVAHKGEVFDVARYPVPRPEATWAEIEMMDHGSRRYAYLAVSNNKSGEEFAAITEKAEVAPPPVPQPLPRAQPQPLPELQPLGWEPSKGAAIVVALAIAIFLLLIVWFPG